MKGQIKRSGGSKAGKLRDESGLQINKIKEGR